MPDARVAKLSREYSHSRAQTERDIPRGRGGYINYYKDLGMSTTEEGHDAFVVAKKKYDSQIASAKSKISDYQKEVDAYVIPSRDNLMQLATQSAKKGFVPVRVVNGNTIEKVYNVPKSVADQYAAMPGISTAWIKGGLNVDVKVAGGRYRGKELHEGLGGATVKINQQINKQASPYVDRAIKDSVSQYHGAIASLTAAKEQVSGYEKLNQEQMNSLRADYQRREKALKEIYDSIYVKDAEGEEDNGSGKVYSAIAAANAAGQSAATPAQS